MTEQTTTTVTIVETTEPVYHHYANQTNPQDCYLELDTRDGRVEARYNPEIGNARPFAVHYGLVRRYPIPSVQASTANALMHELGPLFARVVAGTDEVWDGNNHVAQLDADAETAEREIDARLEELDSDYHVWDAVEWLEPVKYDVQTVLRSGRTVDDLYDEYQGDGSSEDTPYVEGLMPYLERLAAEVGVDPV